MRYINFLIFSFILAVNSYSAFGNVVTAEQEQLLKQLPPDQRDRILDKMNKNNGIDRRNIIKGITRNDQRKFL